MLQLVWEFARTVKSPWEDDESNAGGRERKDFSGNGSVYLFLSVRIKP